MRTSVSVTVSPSNRSLSRSTPWVLGCWGPMLMSIISVRNMMVSSAQLEVIPVVPLGRILLPEGMALPLVGHQDPPQIRMALERDPEQIKRLPFVPVGGAPDAGHRGGRLSVGDADLQINPVPPRDGEEVVNDLETLRAVRVVHPAEVRQVVQTQGRVLLEEPADRFEILLPEEDIDLSGEVGHFHYGLGKLLSERPQGNRLHLCGEVHLGRRGGPRGSGRRRRLLGRWRRAAGGRLGRHARLVHPGAPAVFGRLSFSRASVAGMNSPRVRPGPPSDRGAGGNQAVFLARVIWSILSCS